MANIELLIKTTPNSYSYYEEHSTFHTGDAGLDLFVVEDYTIKAGEVAFISFQIQCQMVETNEIGVSKDVSYYLYARSSLSKTPLMLANGVGVLDSCYRGPIIAALKNTSLQDYKINAGQRLVQICTRNLDSFNIRVVDELSLTSRGNGGFGSTDKISSK